jgi:hypothetical protein
VTGFVEMMSIPGIQTLTVRRSMMEMKDAVIASNQRKSARLLSGLKEHSVKSVNQRVRLTAVIKHHYGCQVLIVFQASVESKAAAFANQQLDPVM